MIGHLSNFELKPLRKYFNDIKHKDSDKWNENKLRDKFGRWICNEWRVNPEKNKKKRGGGDYDYKKLKGKWKSHTGNVVDFWLNLDPAWTVPPYQDNNNKRPPKCQSFILSVNFLNKKYPEWKNWLKVIKALPEVSEYLGDFEESLKRLKTGKEKSYFVDQLKGDIKVDSGKRTSDDLNARVFQFIFDRVKKNDPLNLNEVYSITKKIKQSKRDSMTFEKEVKHFEEALQKSLIPGDLKINPDLEKDDIFGEGTFLHLVCRYYKLRQRARDGRIYIHPEYRFVDGRGYKNTGRFDGKNNLLTYCNHKPRQKCYQLLYDLANLLQVPPDLLENHVNDLEGKTTDEKLFKWFTGINGLKLNCDKAAKEQKDKRGCLKSDIQRVYGILYHNKKSSGTDLKIKEIKQILKKSKVKSADKKDAFTFYSFIEKAKKLCLQVTESLHDKQKHKEFSVSIEKNPASAVYLLAQISNLIFKERSGNAKTCAVCSADNAKRMEMLDGITKAQRLPAIATRLVDGAVMRLARILGTKIAEDKWSIIRQDLKNNEKICVPIVTESNSFEFEPSLYSIKEKPKKGKPKEVDVEKLYQDKKDRIKNDGGGISPYSGESVSDGDLDHIIPRSSKWGTLNDEANLIFTSEKDNRNTKGNNEFSLSSLHQNYKKALFENKTTDEEIKQWIKDQIGDGEGENFKFGQYRSFINLSPGEQKAFRHALFLKGDPIREKVINAIDNRTRTFVNGTQRYFAEVIANNLYKKARKEGLEKTLSFDYFGIEAYDHSSGDNVSDLRRMFADDAKHKLIREYSKEGGQKPYSHLIDAQLEFCIALNKHKNQGTLKANIDNKKFPLEPVDLNTGEFKDTKNTVFDKIHVDPAEFEVDRLKRKKAYSMETYYRQLLNSNKKNNIRISYQIHRDSLISERFIPLIECSDGSIRQGFSIKNSTTYETKDFSNLNDNKFLIKSKYNKKGFTIYYINKQKALDFLLDLGAKSGTKVQVQTAKLLDDLSYKTMKKNIIGALTVKQNNPPKTVQDALDAWDKSIVKNQQKYFRLKKAILIPSHGTWNLLKQKMMKANPSDLLNDFLKKEFSSNQKHAHKHQKVRKVFSLPVKSRIGSIRIKRSSWNRKDIVQTVADEGLATYGYEGKDRPHTILSRNSIPKKHYKGLNKSWKIEPLKWVPIPAKDKEIIFENSKLSISEIYVRHKDAGRCLAMITLDSSSAEELLTIPINQNNWKGKIFKHDCMEKLTEAKKDSKHYHCLEDQFNWFPDPFIFRNDRNEIEITKRANSMEICFTIAKNDQVKNWLNNGNKKQS